MTVPYKCEGFHTATPYLICKDAKAAIDFYKKAFNATEIMQLDMPDGRLAHGEIKIGDSPIMLSDEHPDMNIRGPKTLGGTPVSIMLYVEDSDAMFAQALAAGAKELRPVKDQFYGDRSGTLEDPFGHHWTISTHKEDVPPEELETRMKAAMGG
ncbi:VOC family protein [Phycisphaeraceae bacterium D3-23]